MAMLAPIVRYLMRLAIRQPDTSASGSVAAAPPQPDPGDAQQSQTQAADEYHDLQCNTAQFAGMQGIDERIGAGAGIELIPAMNGKDGAGSGMQIDRRQAVGMRIIGELHAN